MGILTRDKKNWHNATTSVPDVPLRTPQHLLAPAAGSENHISTKATALIPTVVTSVVPYDVM